MNLSAPTMPVFIVSLILAVIALLIQLGVFSIGFPAVWVAIVAYAVLLVGNIMSGL